MNRLEGLRTIITGAASGIGRATAERFAEEGASLYLTDLSAEGLAETAQRCESKGATVSTAVVDVRDEDEVDRSVAACVAELGGLDVVCNIAGVQTWAHSHEVPTEDYRLMMDVNLGGTFFHCRAALPHLMDRADGAQGVIINTASTTSLAGLPYSAIYAASKGAVMQLTKSLAVEYAARGVRVNCVAPGSIDTGMTSKIDFPDGIDFNLLMRQNSLTGNAPPADIASVIAMLASADGRHINGELIRIDGAALA